MVLPEVGVVLPEVGVVLPEVGVDWGAAQPHNYLFDSSLRIQVTAVC